MTKIRYFVKGALTLFEESLKRERKTTKGAQICLFIEGFDWGLLIMLLSYTILRYIC